MIFDVFHIVGNTPADKLLLNTFVNDGVLNDFDFQCIGLQWWRNSC
jgi:hypothetical protein